MSEVVKNEAEYLRQQDARDYVEQDPWLVTASHGNNTPLSSAVTAKVLQHDDYMRLITAQEDYVSE